MWSGMIRSFFVPFRFQLLFSFASHLNCKVSSFKFLFGQFAICLDSISFNLIWNTLFQGLKRFVSSNETKCFPQWNKVFPAMKQSVSKHETDRLVGYELPSYSLRLFCQHLSCLTHIWNQKIKSGGYHRTRFPVKLKGKSKKSER